MPDYLLVILFCRRRVCKIGKILINFNFLEYQILRVIIPRKSIKSMDLHYLKLGGIKQRMAGIQKISQQEIAESLRESNRQYLLGNLKSPQLLKHIHDDQVEVGISHYKEFTSDKPHMHSDVTEYQMVLQGTTYIKDLVTNEVTQLKEGDFYVVRNNTPYAQKSTENTKIIFFKHPAINDKILVEVDETTREWLKERI